MRYSLLLLFFAALNAHAQKPWTGSPHEQMLERIIPPGYTPAMLPEPKSRGAQLTQRYCVQCHNLASPRMHEAGRWPSVVQRMVPRMEGKGNMGRLMNEMMAGVEAPGEEETQAIIAYLRKHAMRPLDPQRIPEVNAPQAESFRRACGQCHALPDPGLHSAKAWPRVVARMQDYMKLTNRAVSSQPVPGEPQLRVEDINAFLIRHAKK